MINPLIISRLIEAGYSVYLPVNGDDTLIISHIPEHLTVSQDEMAYCFCTTASQDKDHSPILRCPVEAMMTAVADPVARMVWLIPADLVDARRVLRLGKEMEEFVIPESLSPSYKESKEIRRTRLKELEEDVRKSIERFKK